jgi:hypothetical protein
MITEESRACVAPAEPANTAMEDRPIRMENNKMRQIRIDQLDAGYVVWVGCKQFAFSTRDEMVSKLLEYIDEPFQTEEKWDQGKLF